MNKWGLFGVLVLLAFLLVLKQQHTEKVAPSAVSMVTQPQEATTDLPQIANDANPPPVADNLGGQPIPASPEPPPQQAEDGLCPKGSIKDILSGHGKTWGRSVPMGHAVSRESVENIYATLSKYLSCKAVVQGDVSLCDVLPSSSDRKQNTDYRRACLVGTSAVLFSAYVTGKSNKLSFCETVLNSDDKPSTVSREKFCAAAAKGVTQFCGDPMFAGKKCPIPVNEKDCKNDIYCLAEHNTFRAIKEGNPMLCQGERAAQCLAFLTKDLNACSSLAREASMSYCTYLSLVEDSKKSLLGGKNQRAGGQSE